MMRRCICTLLLAAMLLPCVVRGEARPEERSLFCREDLANCLVLQMVMTGRLTALDISDSLSVRTYAALLPRLLALTEEDIDHFIAEFQVEEPLLERQLHVATGYCLWADILTEPEGQGARQYDARQVLLLFLRSALNAKDVQNRAIIRSHLTDAFIAEMAEMNGLSTGFLEHLFYSDDWRDATETGAGT